MKEKHNDNNTENEVLDISDKLISQLMKVIKASLEYEKETGYNRQIGLTGEVGEILTCKKLGLSLIANKINKGYDALDKNKKMVQIKTRRMDKKGKTTGDFGVFSKQNHYYDYAYFVFLNYNFEIESIHKAEKNEIDSIRRDKKTISVSQAKKCKCIFQNG